MANLSMKFVRFDQGNIPYNIPYFELIKTIQKETFQKIFIIDIRKMAKEQVQHIFSNFDSFNDKLLENEYEQSNINNMLTLFLYNPDQIYETSKNNILNNMKYAIKRFVTEEQLITIMINSSLEQVKSSFCLLYKQQSKLLSKMAHQEQLPIYKLDTKLEIPPSKYTQLFFQKLNEINRYRIESDIGTYFYQLSQILSFHKEQNKMVLLDNIGFEFLDERNKINIIDTLFDYTIEDKIPIVIASSDENTKELVKKRTYHPLIIE